MENMITFSISRRYQKLFRSSKLSETNYEMKFCDFPLPSHMFWFCMNKLFSMSRNEICSIISIVFIVTDTNSVNIQQLGMHQKCQKIIETDNGIVKFWGIYLHLPSWEQTILRWLARLINDSSIHEKYHCHPFDVCTNDITS